MTTKEQEKKALEQIKKIVDGLGQDSYLATAFEGAFEDAEYNIRDDAAYSMKSRWESAKKKADELQRKYDEDMAHLIAVKEHLEKSRDEAQTKAAGNFQEAMEYAKREKELLEAIEQQKQDQVKAVKAIDDLGEQLKQKDLEIMKLKARLFDLMNT